MPEIKYKKIELCKLFDFSITSNSSILTKSFVNGHKGNIPVYGSTMDEEEVSYGYIKDDVKGIKYFCDCLTINRNGSAGYLFFREGRFTINSDVTPLVLFGEYKDCVDLRFVKYALQPIAIKEFSHVKKAGKARLAHIEIKIPINDNGDFDISLQQELALKYQDIEKRKKKLLQKIEYLQEIKVVFNDTSIDYREIELNKMISHHNGNAQYTKEFCQKNKGTIPVYSANNSIPIAYMNKADYSGRFLTYSKNGCAGYISIQEGDFSVNGDRCVVTLNDGFEEIDLDYLKYYLEPIFRSNIKGRMGIQGKNEYTKLNSTMIKKLNIKVPIPIDKKGEFDLIKEREIAEKYRIIEMIKQNISYQVMYMTDVVIDL